MNTRNRFAKVAFTATIVIFLSVAAPQSAVADHSWRTLVGSWVVDLGPGPDGPIQDLATLNWPGTIITSSPSFGAGHGAWKRVGKRDFELKFLTLIPIDNPLGLPPNSTLTVTAFLTVNGSGNVATGTNTGVFADSEGNEILVVAGPVTFTRIEVD